MSEAEQFAQSASVPKAAAPYILLQRVEVQSVGSAIHYNKLGHALYKVYEKAPPLQALYGVYTRKIEPALRSRRIGRDYLAVMYDEFARLRPHLPERARKIVGIGPGVAGLELCLARHYAGQGEAPEVVLIDRSQITDIYYGFHPEASAYNSLDVARQVLTANGHPADKVTTVEAEDVTEATLEGADLVTSLIAWGFHFPVETYLERVHAGLRPGGRLILDVRKETGGREALAAAFGDLTVIHDDPKFERIMAVRA